MHMTRTIRSATSLLFCSLLVTALPACSSMKPAEKNNSAATQAAGVKEHNFARWEKEMSAFEAQDKVSPPAKGGIVFIGSSTVKRWKTLEADFPGLPVINRGFGGSQIVDSTHFAERIIFPYEPRMVVLRAGGNDIHAGKSAEQVYQDYRDFVKKVHARLPKATIVYISTCPTPSRWAERDATKTCNSLIESYSKRHRYLKYVETYDTVLGPDGQPRPELFVADRLHLSPEGYRLMVERVRQVVK